MSKDTDKIILLGVIGLGAFMILQRRPVAGTVAPAAQQRQGNSAASWAQAIATGIAGLGGLFSNRASASDAWRSDPIYAPYIRQGATTHAQAAAWRDSDPDVNGSITDYVGSDGIAFNAPNNVDPWGAVQYWG